MAKKQAKAAGAARPLAPEDIAPGMWVTITHIAHEHPSWLWERDCDAAHRSPEPLRRVLWRADDEDGAGDPLRVVSVCLPFVLARKITGQGRALDVRRHRLVRLPKSYAREARELLRKQPGRSVDSKQD